MQEVVVQTPHNWFKHILINERNIKSTISKYRIRLENDKQLLKSLSYQVKCGIMVNVSAYQPRGCELDPYQGESGPVDLVSAFHP